MLEKWIQAEAAGQKNPACCLFLNLSVLKKERGAHLWLMTFISTTLCPPQKLKWVAFVTLNLKTNMHSSLALLMNVYISIEVNRGVWILLTLENWFNIFLIAYMLLNVLHWSEGFGMLFCYRASLHSCFFSLSWLLKEYSVAER